MGKVRECEASEKMSLADTWAMVSMAGMETLRAMGLQTDMLARTKVVVRGVKRSRLTVWGQWRWRYQQVAELNTKDCMSSRKPNS